MVSAHGTTPAFVSTRTVVLIALFEFVPMVLHGLTFPLPSTLLTPWPSAPTRARAIERLVCVSVELVLWAPPASSHDVLVALSPAKIATVMVFAFQ